LPYRNSFRFATPTDTTISKLYASPAACRSRPRAADDPRRRRAPPRDPSEVAIPRDYDCRLFSAASRRLSTSRAASLGDAAIAAEAGKNCPSPVISSVSLPILPHKPLQPSSPLYSHVAAEPLERRRSAQLGARRYALGARAAALHALGAGARPAGMIFRPGLRRPAQASVPAAEPDALYSALYGLHTLPPLEAMVSAGAPVIGPAGSPGAGQWGDDFVLYAVRALVADLLAGHGAPATVMRPSDELAGALRPRGPWSATVPLGNTSLRRLRRSTDPAVRHPSDARSRCDDSCATRSSSCSQPQTPGRPPPARRATGAALPRPESLRPRLPARNPHAGAHGVPVPPGGPDDAVHRRLRGARSAVSSPLIGRRIGVNPRTVSQPGRRIGETRGLPTGVTAGLLVAPLRFTPAFFGGRRIRSHRTDAPPRRRTGLSRPLPRID